VSGEFVLALDLGTTNLRCFLHRVDGTLLSSARQPYPILPEDDLSELARQFDPEALASTIETAIHMVLSDGIVEAEQIAAIGITSQREGFATLDQDGKSLYIGPNLDMRAIFQGAAIDEKYAGLIYRLTGHLPSFFFAPAKLLWLKSNDPIAFQRTTYVISLAAWAANHLTGTITDEVDLQGELGILDIKSGQPATEVLSILGLDPSWFPPPMAAGSPIGYITPSVAQRTGLHPKTPVTLAGPDAHSGLLGMGVVRPGQVGIVAGWSSPVQMVTEKPVFDRMRRTWTGLHIIPNTWILESSPGDTGTSYDRVRSLVAPNADHDELHRLANRAPLGSMGVTAFLGPQPMDLSHPSLVPGGLLFPVPMTYLKVEREHLVRAALENIGYAVRASLERVEVISRKIALEVHLGGGLAANPVFVDILTNVLDRPLTQHAPEVSGAGTALCAATAAGVYQNLTQSAEMSTTVKDVIQPDPITAAEYRDYYDRWCRLRRRMVNLTEVIE
jgi:sugar (pentulose or hexulose) kinase